MNQSEDYALRIATDVFHKKCVQLARHRNPQIFQKDNKELFSNWFEHGLDNYEIQKLGANEHPDLIINGVGMELKSLRGSGHVQFNSTIPCGGFKHGELQGECFYAVARYTTERDYGYLADFTICDGDFFNHNRQWAFSHHNDQEKGFGDYGDGVCRLRKMYSFPSPIRYAQGITFISKFDFVEEVNSNLTLDFEITRSDREGQEFRFYVYKHNLIP